MIIDCGAIAARIPSQKITAAFFGSCLRFQKYSLNLRQISAILKSCLEFSGAGWFL
jgi:hypothetical protein